MTFWQENYHFIKEIYEMRHTKMAEWMENVEKAISRIMADKVYTSAEFKRERDNFHVCLTPRAFLEKIFVLNNFYFIFRLCAKTWNVRRSRSGFSRSLKS